TNGGSSIYHSGQLNVARRFKNNFTLTGGYTWARLIDNASEVFAAGGTSSTSLFALPAIFGGGRLDPGLSVFVPPHPASFSYVYELPFMREQRGLLGRLGGGWQISGVTVFESGVPFTVFNGFDSDGIGGANERPTFNPNGQPGVRAVPVVATATNPGPPGTPLGAIIGYVNPDKNNAPIDPNTARYIANPTFTAGTPGSVPPLRPPGPQNERPPGNQN